MANDAGPNEGQLVEHEGESALGRSLRPIIVLAPLTLAVLVPGAIYGLYSSRAANDAFSFVEAAMIVDNEGTSLDPAGFCDGEDAGAADLTFYELAENADEARASLTNVGFNAATVDFKGWLEAPTASDTAAESGSSTEQDLRDDISFIVSRHNSSWCIEDITVK